MKLSVEANEVWAKHVLAQYPNEACAYVVDGNIMPVENLSDKPTTSFKVSAMRRLEAHAKGNVQAFLHSHPYTIDTFDPKWHPSWMSHADMVSWIADNIPWGIAATDGEGLSSIEWYDDSMEAIQPWEGRDFVSGKTDCLSILRDYYRKDLGITFPNYPRSAGWWDEGKDLYITNFAHAGFYEVSLDDIQVNDLLLMRFDSKLIVHGAVVTGTNQILHHCYNRLSGYDTLSKWHRQVEKAIRYKDFK